LCENYERKLTALETGRAAMWSRYARGLGITVLCTGIAYPVYPYFDPVNIVMVYLLGATVAGLRLGRGPSALTAVANTAAFDFFFVPPRYSFYVAETQYLFTLGVMLGVAVIIANLMVNVRRQTESAAERERRTATLYALSRELVVAADSNTIAEVAARHVGSALEAASVVLLPDERGALSIRGRSDASGLAVDESLASWVFEHNRLPLTGTTAHSELLYLPLAGSQQPRGVLVARALSNAHLMPERQALLDALAGQIALALERASLAEQAAAARATAERAALRNTLLASISHDLRGPLSAIAGAGSLVAQSSGALDRHRRQTLGFLIEEKARDMSGLLSNVLELMRLETGAEPPRADWQSVEELVGIALRNNEHRLSRWQVVSTVPIDFPLLRVDAILMVQLLSNLLENASKHTPPGTRIEVCAQMRGEQALIIVEDDGPGFGERDPERLFEKFERGQKEGHASGVGLGLAICRAIARLHSGEIRAAQRTGGGARFEISLPQEPVPLESGRDA
jgi:two-component system, OmpR family, sensor histidine kinase KdpD